jgi:hypothetical protein
MDFEEFLIWMDSEPDSYELVDGEPIRMAEQGGRRMGSLFQAAELSMGEKFVEWARTPMSEIGGRIPYLYVTESWGHLAAVLQLLRDPEDGRTLMGERFSDIRDRASRLSSIERQRAHSTTDAWQPGSLADHAEAPDRRAAT